MRFSQLAFSVTLVAAVSAGPISGDYHQRRAAAAAAAFALKNGQDAQALNQKFQSLSSSSPCSSSEQACVQGQLAQCVGGKFVMTPCASTLQCVALPLVNKPGTRYVPRIIITGISSRSAKHIDTTTALRVTPSKTRKRALRTQAPQVVSSESARSQPGTSHLSCGHRERDPSLTRPVFALNKKCKSDSPASMRSSQAEAFRIHSRSRRNQPPAQAHRSDRPRTSSPKLAKSVRS